MALPLKTKENSAQYFTIFIVFSLSISLLGFITNNYVQSVIKQNIVNELSYIATLKKTQISDWLKDKKAQAEFFNLIPINANPVLKKLDSPADEIINKNTYQWMSSVKETFHYDNVMLYSKSKVLLQQISNLVYPTSEINKYIDSLLISKNIIVSDFILVNDKPEQLFFVPVFSDMQKTDIKGVVVFSSSPDKFIYSLLKDVPPNNKSFEIILFRYEKDSITYLNKLKYSDNQPLKNKIGIGPKGVRISLKTEKDENNIEYIDYIDYRNTNVLGIAKYIPEMKWYLVAKIDKNEVFKVKNLFLIIIIVFFSIIIISGGSILFIIQRKNYIKYYQDLLEKEGEKEIIEKKYQTLSKFANIIIIVTDEMHNILEVNEKAIKTYGYSLEEFRKLKIIDLVDKSDTNNFNGSSTNQPIGEGVYFEGINKRKDSSTFYVEINLSDIYLDNKKYYQLIIQDVTERKTMISEIKKSLSEKEVLLNEIHHRVKNNLNIIYSLLTLQALQIKNDETKSLFDEAKSRIKSMALVHEQLYESKNFSKLNVENYIQELVNTLLLTYGFSNKYIKSEVIVGNFYLNIDTLIPLGLIINELVTNSIKYAFEGRNEGKIYITLANIGGENYELFFADDGIGLSSDFDIDQVDTLGLSIVKDLTLQLDGTLNISTHTGAEFRIIFKEA